MRGAVFSLVALAGTAGADPPRNESRVGSITAEAAIGAAFTFNTCADPIGCPGNGVEPLTVAGGVGEWFTESSVLELRLTDTSHKELSSIYTLAFLGPAIQQWIGAHFWVGGGLGVAFARSTKTVAAFSVDVRAGVVLIQRQRHAWSLSVEAAPAIGDNDTSTPVSLLLGYQYL